MPRRKIHVRDHDRRKPHKEEEIHVRDYDRTLEIVAPRGSEEEFLKARTQFEHRSERSKAQDLRLEATDTGLIEDTEHVQEWRRAPERHDIAGIDDTLYGPRLEDLAIIKQVFRERLGKFSRVSGAIIRKTKATVEKLTRAPKVPAREKRKRIARVKKQAKKEIEQAAKKDLKEVKKTQGLIHRITRAVKRWSTERRRRANYVAETVKCNPIEADSLIRRAHLKGWDYDTVDWDELQGKDLQYDERVDKLEQMIGKTYTEGEYESVVQAQKEHWEELMAERKKEVDAIEQLRREYKPYKPQEYEIPLQTYGYT